MVRDFVYRECVNKWERFIDKFDEIEELSINLVKGVFFYLSSIFYKEAKRTLKELKLSEIVLSKQTALHST